MDPILAFLFEHWLLSSIFIVILLLLLVNEWRLRSLGMKAIEAQQLVDLINHHDAQIVDIRAVPLYEQGHILKAINLPQEDFANRLNMLNKYKMKPVVLVCASGTDSPKMGKILKANGFTELYYLMGGMPHWLSSGMPVVKK